MWKMAQTDITLGLEQERQGQRQNAMATLEAHIASLAKEKADLEARNALLEQAATLRLKQERIDSTPGYMDGEFFVEVSCVPV